MTQTARPAEADGGPVGRGQGAAYNPCAHSTAVTLYAQARVVCEVRGANGPAAHPAEPVAEQLCLPMEVAPWPRR